MELRSRHNTKHTSRPVRAVKEEVRKKVQKHHAIPTLVPKTTTTSPNFTSPILRVMGNFRGHAFPGTFLYLLAPPRHFEVTLRGWAQAP